MNSCDEIFQPEVVRKTIVIKMFIRTIPTTLLQIFCKTIFNFLVIVKYVLDPDNYTEFLSMNRLGDDSDNMHAYTCIAQPREHTHTAPK